MFQTAEHINFRTLEDGLPAFATLILIPLTLSITQGLLWGFVLHTLLYALSGRARELSVTVWVLAAVSVGLLILEHA
jgi:AGZA family xanthine/uracil permease-like MFS transporter